MEYCKRLDGILALWKPTGITSAKFCDRFKKVIRKELTHTKGRAVQDMIKVGHGGTLDITASGVLAVGLGPSCKLLKHLLHGQKVYRAVGCLGIETTTYNEYGAKVDQKPYDHVTLDLINETTEKFCGNITQKPPEYSALKLHGRRLSDLVEEGYVIPEDKLRPRPVYVHSIKIVDFSPPQFTVEIHCGGGFYVRSFINDLGKAMSTCAYMGSLERLQHGPFTTEDVLPEAYWNYMEIVKELSRTKKITKKILDYKLKDFKKKR